MSATTTTTATTTATTATQMFHKEDSQFIESDLFLDTTAITGHHEDNMIVPKTAKVDSPEIDKAASPFHIHSSVLDSVFSSNLDDPNSNIDHTPMFDELDFILDGAKVNSKDDWVALFGDEEENQNEPLLNLNTIEEINEDDSMIPRDENLEGLFLEASPNNVNLSDDTISAATTQASSPSLSSCTVTTAPTSVKSVSAVKQLATPSSTPLLDTKGTKRKLKELKPITINETDDSIAIKRAKNTLAARKSRERKVQKMSMLENKVEELSNENERLKALLMANGIEF
ncbi:unnamed protein product [Candida verbasci]|uniref:BZIP domain-containing protein n=1 Tax=Candida verbasci TaxID=1227364 RepID=A0A9W4TX34_9ASCO|nr:unnamed protein product [Candida verbasci]